jgi:bifunctional N-acetylglucosamine-1-phosphate-uridyltransferase/glucosamine-1-phosphate-acetyltransferase GlmU-like protein
MIDVLSYISRFNLVWPELVAERPWNLTTKISSILSGRIQTLGSEYRTTNDVAIHSTASVDDHAIIKGPAIVGPGCFVGAHAYLRGGVFLDERVSIGPGCELKTTFIFSHSAVAHFNFIGDSVIGSRVNFEAGSIAANHWNERTDKDIFVFANGASIATGVQKFGSLVGDDTKIGANAVLSPGTILAKHAIVSRLQLIEQGLGIRH